MTTEDVGHDIRDCRRAWCGWPRDLRRPGWHLFNPPTPAPSFTVTGVRAAFWAADTGQPRETLERDGLTRGQATDLARYLSTSHLDDGAVDYWPEVGGHVEIRDGARLVAAYVNGRRFSPSQWRARLAALGEG